MLLLFVCNKKIIIKTFWFDETVSRLKSFFIEHIFIFYFYLIYIYNNYIKGEKQTYKTTNCKQFQL